MQCDYQVSNFRGGEVTLMDGAGHTLVVPLEVGDFAISGITPTNTEMAVYKSRGRTVAVKQTNDVEPSISFSAMLSRMTSLTKTEVLDFVRFTGYYSTNQAASSICNGGKLLDIKWALETEEGTEYIIARAVGITSIDTGDGDPNSIKFSATAYNPAVEFYGAT